MSPRPARLSARVKRLAIMDQDGANHRYLTDGRTIVLTPRFSPTPQEITYLAYAEDAAAARLSAQHRHRPARVLGDFPGMTFAPRFSPDGNRVVLSVSAERPAATSTTSTCAPARCAPDQQAGDRHLAVLFAGRRQIVFNSDRGGSQQLYVMSADGGDARRISFGEGRYATPVWSPRGDYIAFTKIDGGSFSIGVMRPDGGGERMLTQGFLVEGPTWAPNGRVLMYFRQQPQFGRARRLGHAASDRRDRPQRAPGADADRRVGSGLVTLDSAVAKRYDLSSNRALLTRGCAKKNAHDQASRPWRR